MARLAQDPKLHRAVRAELRRLEEQLTLIPSENHPSPAVMRLEGSALMSKYSEGYPGRRYYPGNALYDEIERRAQANALALFKLSPRAWAANVQPYSGSPGNLGIYAALLSPGDTLLGMQLAAGGHLTHGHRATFSGKWYRAVQYAVDPETNLLDYAEIARLARKHKPKLIVSGATAYPRAFDFKKFGAIAKSVGAHHLADVSHIAGLIAGGVHPTPFPHADVVMMTTHKTLRGPRGAVILSRTAISDAIDRAIFPGLQGGPHDNTTAAIAEALFEAKQPGFRRYARAVVKNAAVLSRALIEHGFTVTTGGTDNHLFLVDMRPLGLDGTAAERALEKNGILANRNSVPGDTSPFRPSGIRVGTPAATSRGMGTREMERVADLIAAVLLKKKNVKRDVRALCKRFPLP